MRQKIPATNNNLFNGDRRMAKNDDPFFKIAGYVLAVICVAVLAVSAGYPVYNVWSQGKMGKQSSKEQSKTSRS